MNIDQLVKFVQAHYETTEFIPLHEPRFTGKEKEYLLDTIDSTFVSSVGAYVDKAEEMIAKVANTDKAIAVVNGTAALHVALRLAGVKHGDEVLTQALTFVATANAVAYNNANPVFLDVDLDTMGLSPISVNSFLEEYGEKRADGCYNKKTGKRISACLPMHTFGFPAHLNELLNICNAWNIPVVEDAAESIGSTYHSRPTGSYGHYGTYSFNGNKVITSGGGGAILTNDKDSASLVKHITTTAKLPHSYEYDHDVLGYNYRMPNLNAALICAQLEQLNSFLISKRTLAKKYEVFFEEVGIKFRKENPNTMANYWLMCVELANKKERDDFIIETNAKGIMTRPIWKLMYKLPMYKHCFRDSQRNAEFLEDRIVNIPSSVK